VTVTLMIVHESIDGGTTCISKNTPVVVPPNSSYSDVNFYLSPDL
jgi:hypothetical protein